MTPLQFWLVKSEPEAYSWSTFVQEGRTAWTGVRNFQARNNLRTMHLSDLVLFYHSVSEKALVGVAKVERTAYPDPTEASGSWDCVDLAPVCPLPNIVPLSTLKADPDLKDIGLLRQSRLSVLPLTKSHFLRILELGGASKSLLTKQGLFP